MLHDNMKPVGKKVEMELICALRGIGAEVKTALELDHNYKIDFLLFMNGDWVGVQVSTRKDSIKQSVARLCALERVSRFIYLVLPVSVQKKAINKSEAVYLYELLKKTTDKYSNKSFLICWRNGSHSIRSLDPKLPLSNQSLSRTVTNYAKSMNHQAPQLRPW